MASAISYIIRITSTNLAFLNTKIKFTLKTFRGTVLANCLATLDDIILIWIPMCFESQLLLPEWLGEIDPGFVKLTCEASMRGLGQRDKPIPFVVERTKIKPEKISTKKEA